ncbi:MAG: ATP-binding protein [Flavobacteriaceae bacterium]
MKRLQALYELINTRLEAYVRVSGDTRDTAVQKQIWWLLGIVSVPVLLGSIILMWTKLGSPVFYSNILFLLCLLIPIFVFHFHRTNIAGFALFTQISIVILTSVKVYLMGGMMNAVTPVFVGFIGPVYALILPDRKRALLIFVSYILLMILATLMNPVGEEPYLFYKYFLGFLIGTNTIFFTLYYFIDQWKQANVAENNRIKALDDLKTRFYTHIAHEFRTPLSIISGMADQMKSDPDRWLMSGHEMIKRNSQNLISLTNRLLDLSKLEDRSMPLHLVHEDMVLYMRYLVESFHSMADLNEIELSFSSNPEEIYMDMDPDKIRDILSNLISNAIKFTPKNGSVVVSLSLMEKESAPFIRLRVADTGVGIPASEQDMVFNRYFQARNHLENHTEGTGLGLALTRELVRLMGGNISMISTLGKGSVFKVDLPITRQVQSVSLPPIGKSENTHTQLAFGKPSQNENSHNVARPLKLLLVDDNSDVIRYLRSLLEEDYSIDTATNGAKGFQKALISIPDLIISDVMMPGVDGLEFSRKLKADMRTSHIPIVLLTARSDFDSRIEGLSSGADAYLSKPFNKRELFVRIDKLIALRKGLQRRYVALADRKLGREKTLSGVYQREDAFMHKVRELLEAHLGDEEFGITQLCDALAMSRSQLYRKFSALSDMTVNQFIIALRIEKARQLLANTDLNVSEVAYDTGFKHPAHFSRAFAERFGYPPSKEKVG